MKPWNKPLTPGEEEAINAHPFRNPEDTAKTALELAHREIVRLSTQGHLVLDDVKALETLARVVERWKDVELKEHKIRGSCPRCHGQGR